MTKTINIASRLKTSTENHPHKRAVVFPDSRNKKGRVLYSQMTFTQLDMESDRLAAGLERINITRGTRTILMVTPGLDFFTLTFALFKVGAVPVVVDPGMGISRMLSCLNHARPTAFIGIEKAHILRKLRPGYFKKIRTWVTVGKRWFWGGHSLDQLKQTDPSEFQMAQTQGDETAAILFTTGSTGPAKGVVYTHQTFDAQITQIQEHFSIGADEIDLPTFPLFALFDPALGMTAVIPDMDPTKPALVNPIRIIEAIENHGITNMFASPALLNRVGGYGKKMKISLPSLRRVVSAGAPVTPANIEQFSSMLTGEARIHTPYGATEAVPVVSINSEEILNETKQFSEKGFGMCVGRPICDTKVKIITISDDPIETWDEALVLPENEVGEIAVKAALVTKNYFENPKADHLSKIKDPKGGIWHRMGDLGWRDSKDRIWFCGRKGHRVITQKGTLFTIPCEAIFNNHKKIFRTALVGIGPRNRQTPVICIELAAPISDKKEFIREIHDLAVSHDLTQGIDHFLIHKSFPVDIRHNSKIFREKLAIWAQQKLRDHSKTT